MSQTTIRLCEFCAEPSVDEVVLTPAVLKNGAVIEKAIKAWVCGAHRRSVRGGEGLQERLRKARAKRAKELKEAASEAVLFDPGPSTKRQTNPYGEAA